MESSHGNFDYRSAELDGWIWVSPNFVRHWVPRGSLCATCGRDHSKEA